MKTVSPVVILGNASSNTGSCGKVMDENTFPVGRVWEKKMQFLYVAVHILQIEGFTKFLLFCTIEVFANNYFFNIMREYA